MKKRVLCLYRVSTKQQVNAEDDIPVQRRECLDFINRMPGWEFVGEKLEKGVSGFKVSASKRDAIQEIRQMAEKKEFDILLVFMFDRLGRREDETPFLVEWFVNHGIEVWSTREGQQRIDNRGDKLMNYIRYWMAGGESEKTSLRVKAAHTQMTEDGVWRGGKVPYGYRLVHKGRMGKKNRQLYDLEVDPEQAILVQDLFQMLGKGGLGTLRAANALNQKYPDCGKTWTPQTVREMAKNPIYTGRFHMNDTVSEPIEELRLISDADFAFIHRAMQDRIPRKERMPKKENGDYGETKWSASDHSAKLLCGLLYCKACGGKMVGSYNKKKTQNTVHYWPVYRCYRGALSSRRRENEQYSYTAEKIESAVLTVVRSYFASFARDAEAVWKEQVRRQLRTKHDDLIRELQAKVEKLQKQQTKLRQEVVNSLSGDSSFDTPLLKSLLDENVVSLKEAEAQLAECQKEKDTEESRLKNMYEQFSRIAAWSEEFDTADVETKKMILARIIEKITIEKGYKIHISFYLTREEIMKEVHSGEVEISEADTWYLTGT